MEKDKEQACVWMWRRKNRLQRRNKLQATLKPVSAKQFEFSGQRAVILKYSHHIKRAASQHFKCSVVVYWHFPLYWVVSMFSGRIQFVHTQTLNCWTNVETLKFMPPAMKSFPNTLCSIEPHCVFFFFSLINNMRNTYSIRLFNVWDNLYSSAVWFSDMKLGLFYSSETFNVSFL